MTKTRNKVIVLLMLLMASSMAVAGQVDNLYQADVAAEADAERWQQQALLQVLTKVSGDAEVAATAGIATELKQASGYIKQFEVVRQADGNRMRVLLDASKVNQLLQQHNIAIWGALRPDILVWLVQQQNGERSFVRRADMPLNKALRQAFKQSALPLLQPLYDMDDIQAVSETDVWAGFWQQINLASSRYKPDVVLAVAVDQITDNGALLYRLSWQRQDNGRTWRDEVLAADENTLMQSFAITLAAQLAKQYASVMLQGNDLAEIQLEVQGLDSLTDLVQVQKLLQQMVGVSEVTIVRYAAAAAHYQLRSSISAQSLLNALRFNPRLRLQADDISAIPAVVVSQQPVLATFSYIRN